jgi:hypothetical protein
MLRSNEMDSPPPMDVAASITSAMRVKVPSTDRNPLAMLVLACIDSSNLAPRDIKIDVKWATSYGVWLHRTNLQLMKGVTWAWPERTNGSWFSSPHRTRLRKPVAVLLSIHLLPVVQGACKLLQPGEGLLEFFFSGDGEGDAKNHQHKWKDDFLHVFLWYSKIDYKNYDKAKVLKLKM